MSFTLRPAADSDRPWLRQFMVEHWGAEEMIDRDRVFYPAEHPAFVAESEGQAVGVITYQFENGTCEVTSLTSLESNKGIGGALMERVEAEARARGCRRLWLVTTNDNVNALKFYQKRGFRLVALYPGAIDQARQLKPGIPLIGQNGIPLRDEIELELLLD
jgi:N-acetylglutamate synthase-like GNAT family acetyltransferase